MKSSSSPTSQDVARHAGVSRSIVSGVLNGTMSTMRVSAATRERVLAAAQELGYTPNPVARALRRQRSNVLGYVPRLERVGPYDSPVPFLLTMHLANACIEHGYHIVEASTESQSRHHGDLVQFLLGRHVDGVVLDSPKAAEEVARLLDRGLPVVQMMRPQLGVATPSVTVDAAPGTTEAIEHLLDMGHRDIAFIGICGAHPVDRARLDTFLKVLASRGVAPREDWVILADAYSTRHGYESARRLLSAPEQPTALFVTGDNLAIGVLQHLYERHIRIPEHLSVISYDDVFARHMAPPLTSVNQPLQDAADRAISLLAAEVDTSPDRRYNAEAVVLPSHLVKRGSVGRISTS